MPFALAILLFIAFVCLESSEKSARNKIDKSWEENEIAGYTEYVYAWYIFWDEVMPKTYEELLRLNKRENWHEMWALGMSGTSAEFVYSEDRDFSKAADSIYNGSWGDYCVRKAKQRMVEEGRHLYNPLWRRQSNKYQLDEWALAEERKPLEERHLGCRHELGCRFVEPPAFIPQDVLELVPPETDRRRYECVALDGERVWKLTKSFK